MAQGGQGSQEKTEDATPKRMREARKKGQVAKSKDLSTLFVLIATFATLAITMGYIGSQLGSFTRDSLMMPQTLKNPTVQDMAQAFEQGVDIAFKVSAPFLGAAFLAALFIGFIQVGGVFSLDPLTPKLEKLNPIEGLKNMFKMKTFVELIKNIIKMAAIFALSYVAIIKYFRDFMLTISQPIEESVKVGGMVMLYFLVLVAIVFIIVSIADVMWQRHDHKKEMRMSKDEVKREYKEDEGDPQFKHHRKQIHQEMAMSDVPRQVAQSDVVITNPTHIAIAIRYDGQEMGAPEIMAKGQRLTAARIREYAEEFDIPIIRNIPLAWALIEFEVGDEISEELFQAVAEVLAFVYRLKAEQEHKAWHQQRP